MDWSPISATNAYLETLKLCSKHKENFSSCEAQEPESNEFISALAAGMSAKLIVEVTPEVSTSTVALAAAARQTGGKLVCIVPEPNLDESQKAIEDSGLDDIVEFNTGDPIEVLPSYENVDFSLVDCKTEDYDRLLEKLDVNPRRSMVVANNIILEGRKTKGIGGNLKRVENRAKVRSMKHPIGKGLEVALIGKSSEGGRRERSIRGLASHSHGRGGERKNGNGKRNDKSKWLFEIDEKSGEEHIYRVPKAL